MADNAKLRTMADDITKDLSVMMQSLGLLATSVAEAMGKMHNLKTLLRENDTNGSKP